MKKVFESPELRVLEYQNEVAMSVSTTEGGGVVETPDDEW